MGKLPKARSAPMTVSAAQPTTGSLTDRMRTIPASALDASREE